MEPAISFQPAINYSSSAAYTGGQLAYNFCNKALLNDTRQLINQDLYIEEFYFYVCPTVIFVCFFSIIFNATLMSISRQSKLINKSPIMLLSLNLAFTDLIASTLNGLTIFFGSYLRVVFLVPVNSCAILTLELFRFTAVLASSLHLLALAFVHYRGTVNPLHYRSSIFYSRHLSRTINIISVCCWLVPLTLMIVWFNSTPCQGFQTAECDFFFFLGYNWRRMILTAFAVPLLFMSIIYVRIFLIISRHQKGLRLPPPSQQQLSGSVASGRVLGGDKETRQSKQINGGDPPRAPGAGRTTEQRHRIQAKNCPVCSLRNQFQESATNKRSETTIETVKTDVESVSILSEEVEATDEEKENTWTGNDKRPAARGQCETAALMGNAQAVRLIQKGDDDSYTIRNNSQLEATASDRLDGGGGAGANGPANDYNGTKLICNGKAAATVGDRDAAAAVCQLLRSEPVTGTKIDNDPNGRARKQAPLLVDLHRAGAESRLGDGSGDDQEDDDDDHDAAAWMKPTKLNCERQPPSLATAWALMGPAGASKRVAAAAGAAVLSRPLADHASATSGDCVVQALQQPATGTTNSPRQKSHGPAQLANHDHDHGGGSNCKGEANADATAQQLHGQRAAAATAPQPPGGALGASSLRAELVSESDSLCGPKRELLTDTDYAAVFGPRSPASNQMDLGLVTSLGGDGSLQTESSNVRVPDEFGKVVGDTSNGSSALTASEKLRRGQKNKTIATSLPPTELQQRQPKMDPVDGRGGGEPTLWCTCDNKLNQSTIKSLRRSNTVASPANAAAIATHRRAITKTTKLDFAPAPPSSISSEFVANSSLRFQLKRRRPRDEGEGGGGGSSSEAHSSASSSSGSEASGSCNGGSSGSSNGGTAAEQEHTKPLHRTGAKFSSLHVSTGPAIDATSMTVTTLTSGHPAHNFDSSSSFSNRDTSSHYRRHHHHKHHRHHHQEPQRVNVKKVAVPPTNTKALVTTLLILGTYFVSYLPVLVFQMLTCIDGCRIPLYQLKPKMRLFFGTITTLLLIAKSIVDPLIYSYRTNEVQQAISRYMSKRRSKSSSRATSLNASQRYGGAGSQATQGSNLNTSSFKLFKSTNSSLRTAPSRAASVRVNQHHFDRPGQVAVTTAATLVEEGDEFALTKLADKQALQMVSICNSAADQEHKNSERDGSLQAAAAKQSDIVVNHPKQQMAAGRGGRDGATRQPLSSCQQKSNSNSTTPTNENAEITAKPTRETTTANSSRDTNRANEQAASDKLESDIPNATTIQNAAERSASSRDRPLDKTKTTATTTDIVC